VNIDIVERAPARVAYLRYTGPLGEPLGRFWRATVAPWLADHDLIDCPRYGVALDDPARTPPENFRYDACVELPRGLTLPDAEQTTIPGGRYAVTCFKGTGAQIGPAWDEFLAAIAARGLTPDGARAPFEHYPRGATWDHRTGAFGCELCVPLASQAAARLSGDSR
jgi:AraC family transcriptional regulator